MKVFKKLNPKGFGHVEGLIIVLVLVIIGGAYFLVHASHADTTTPQIVIPDGGGSNPTYKWTTVASYTSYNPVVNIFACQATDTAKQVVVVGMAAITKDITSVTPYQSTLFEGKVTANSYAFIEYDTNGPLNMLSSYLSNKTTGTWGLYRKPLSARISLAVKSSSDVAAFAVQYAGQKSVTAKSIAISKLGKCF
jgi:hypothetical protein